MPDRPVDIHHFDNLAKGNQIQKFLDPKVLGFIYRMNQPFQGGVRGIKDRAERSFSAEPAEPEWSAAEFGMIGATKLRLPLCFIWATSNSHYGLKYYGLGIVMSSFQQKISRNGATAQRKAALRSNSHYEAKR